MRALAFAVLATLLLAPPAYAEGLIDEVRQLRDDLKTLRDENKALRERLDALEPAELPETLSHAKQAQAQGACIGLYKGRKGGEWIRAVFRPRADKNGWAINRPDTWRPSGGDNRVSCDEVCRQLIDHPDASQERRSDRVFTCYDTIHVYAQAPIENTAGVTGFKTHYYGGGCGASNTGPNYCCCATKPKP